MLFPLAADVEADLVLWAPYFEVSIPAPANKKLLDITAKNICTLQIVLKMLYNTKTNIWRIGLKLKAS